MSDKNQGDAPDDNNPASEVEQKNDAGRESDARASVTDTASAEISLAIETERALDRHDERWDVERDRLATNSFPSLEMDGVQKTSHEHKEEYDLARTRWKLAQDKIYDGYQSERGEIREEGQTLRDEFTALSGPSESAEYGSTPAEHSVDPAGEDMAAVEHAEDLHAEFDQELSMTFNTQSQGRSR